MANYTCISDQLLILKGIKCDDMPEIVYGPMTFFQYCEIGTKQDSKRTPMKE